MCSVFSVKLVWVGELHLAPGQLAGSLLLTSMNVIMEGYNYIHDRMSVFISLWFSIEIALFREVMNTIHIIWGMEHNV